jgi:hypothetical protein
MTTLATITYDGGTAGNPAGTEAGWDTASPTGDYEVAAAEAGGMGVKITGSAVYRKTISSTNKWRVRWFNELPTPAPGSNTTLAIARSSTTARAQVRLTLTGTYQLLNVASISGSPSSSISAGVRDRLEWWCDGDAGTQGLDIFRGSNRNGTTPDEQLSATFTNATADNIGVGLFVSVTSFVVRQDEIVMTDVPGTAIGGVALAATPTPAAVAGVASVPAPTISLSVVVQPAVVAGVATVPSLTAQLTASASPDPVGGVATIPAPAITAQRFATATPAVVTGFVFFPTAQIAAISSNTVVPETVAGVAVVLAPFRVGSPPVAVGALDDMKFAWLGARTTGATVADRELSYYAALSGLPVTRSLADHKVTYLRAQTGLGASAGMTELEMTYWAIVDPSNNTGSYQDRARRFYAT